MKWYIHNYRKNISQFWLYVLKVGNAKGSEKKGYSVKFQPQRHEGTKKGIPRLRGSEFNVLG